MCRNHACFVCTGIVSPGDASCWLGRARVSLRPRDWREGSSASFIPHTTNLSGRKKRFVIQYRCHYSQSLTGLSLVYRSVVHGFHNNNNNTIYATQINTPDGLSDYFLPLRFDVRESTNELVADLLDTVIQNRVQYWYFSYRTGQTNSIVNKATTNA